MRKKLVGQAFRAAIKSAYMRPYTSNKVSDDRKVSDNKAIKTDRPATPTFFSKSTDVYHRSFPSNSVFSSNSMDYKDSNIYIYIYQI